MSFSRRAWSPVSLNRRQRSATAAALTAAASSTSSAWTSTSSAATSSSGWTSRSARSPGSTSAWLPGSSLGTLPPCSSSSTCGGSSDPGALPALPAPATDGRPVTETVASGSRVRLLIRGPQPLDRHVGVDLRGGERSVAEQLLNRAQVRTSLEQVRRRRVPQSVRPDVVRAGHVRDEPVHRLADLPLVGAAATPAEQQGGPAGCRRQCGTPVGEP